jgi:predicted nucleotidyltransferase
MKNENIRKIQENIRKNRKFLKDTYHVKEMGIFGSVVRGGQKKGSDIDILVDFSKPIGLFAFVRLERFLSQILKKKVDLVSKKAIKPAIEKEILDEVLYV